MDIIRAQVEVLGIDSILDEIRPTNSVTPQVTKTPVISTGILQEITKLGLTKETKYLLSRWVTLAFIGTTWKDNLIPKSILKRRVSTLSYVAKGKESGREFHVNTKSNIFDNHVLITIDKDIFNHICQAQQHNKTYLFLIDDASGEVLDKRHFINKPQEYDLGWASRKIFSVSLGKISNDKTRIFSKADTIKKVYEHFERKAEWFDFGNGGKYPFTTHDKRDPLYPPGILESSANNADNAITHADSTAHLSSRNTTRAVTYLTDYLDGSYVVRSNSIRENKSELNHKTTRGIARYLDSKKVRLYIETEAIIGVSGFHNLLYSLSDNDNPIRISYESIQKIYAYAKRMEMHHDSSWRSDGTKNEDIDHNSIIDAVDQKYGLNLKNHQKHAVNQMLKHRAIVLRADVGLGKCVDASSFIWYDKGMKRIKDFQKKQHSKRTWTEKLKVNLSSFDKKLNVLATTSELYKDSNTSGFEIELEHGYKIKTSKIHPLWIEDNGSIGWAKTKDIYRQVAKNRDIYVPIKVGHNLWETKNKHIIGIELTVNLAYVLGALVGDGTLRQAEKRNNNYFQFTSADMEIVNNLRRFIIESKLTLNRFKKCTGSTNGKASTWGINCPQLANLLRELKLTTTSYHKRIPDEILSSPKKVLIGFLQGLFDTDGSSLNTGYVEYCSASQDLANDVHQVLLALGIPSSLRYKDNDHAGAWIVSIFYYSPEFYNIIGFKLRRKQLRKNLLPEFRNQNWRIYPPSISKVIKEEWKTREERDVSLPKNIHAHNNTNKNSIASKAFKIYGRMRVYWQGGNPPKDGLETFMKFAKVSESSKLHEYYLNGQIIWLKVKSVRKCKVDLYDFVVPKTHSFIANGTISHNSRSAIAAALAKNIKHTLILTDAGHIPEMRREFVEQIKSEQLEEPHIIKTLDDCKNLKKFNILSYSTLAKSIESEFKQHDRLVMSAVSITRLDSETPSNNAPGLTITCGTNKNDVTRTTYPILSAANSRWTTLANKIEIDITELLKLAIESGKEIVTADDVTNFNASKDYLTINPTQDVAFAGRSICYMRLYSSNDEDRQRKFATVIRNIKKSISNPEFNIDFAKADFSDKKYAHNITQVDRKYISPTYLYLLMAIYHYREYIINDSIISKEYPILVKYLKSVEGLHGVRISVVVPQGIARTDGERYISQYMHPLLLVPAKIINIHTSIRKDVGNLEDVYPAMGKIFVPTMKKIIERCHVGALVSTTSYPIAKALDKKFGMIIYDECHVIKNPAAVRTTAARRMRTKNYIFMSGTPLVDTVVDLQSYLRIAYGDKSLLHMGNYSHNNKQIMPSTLRKKRVHLTINKNEMKLFLDISNNSDDFTSISFPEEVTQQLVRKNVVSITRQMTDIVIDKQWLFDLKQTKNVIKPSPAHMQIYANQMEVVHQAFVTGKYEDHKQCLSILTNLIRISEVPSLLSEDFANTLTNKQEAMVALAQAKLYENRNVIVFTTFHEMSRILAESIAQKCPDRQVYLLTENMNPNARYEIVDAFRKSTIVSCLVGTTSSIGKAFNLGNADTIIMSDIPWSPLGYTQAVGRILRPDQKGEPQVHLVMNDYMIDLYKFDSVTARMNAIKKFLDGNKDMTTSDVTKVDYKAFLVSLLERAVKDKVLSLSQNEVQVLSRGIR